MPGNRFTDKFSFFLSTFNLGLVAGNGGEASIKLLSAGILLKHKIGDRINKVNLFIMPVQWGRQKKEELLPEEHRYP